MFRPGWSRRALRRKRVLRSTITDTNAPDQHAPARRLMTDCPGRFFPCCGIWSAVPMLQDVPVVADVHVLSQIPGTSVLPRIDAACRRISDRAGRPIARSCRRGPDRLVFENIPCRLEQPQCRSPGPGLASYRRPMSLNLGVGIASWRSRIALGVASHPVSLSDPSHAANICPAGDPTGSVRPWPAHKGQFDRRRPTALDRQARADRQHACPLAQVEAADPRRQACLPAVVLEPDTTGGKYSRSAVARPESAMLFHVARWPPARIARRRALA